MLPFYGEATVLAVFSRLWQRREKGISEVTQKLKEVFGKSENDLTLANICLLQLITECLKD